jgi:hypothetical protein
MPETTDYEATARSSDGGIPGAGKPVDAPIGGNVPRKGAWGPPGYVRGQCQVCKKPARHGAAFYCETHAPAKSKGRVTRKAAAGASRTRVTRPAPVPPGESPPTTGGNIGDPSPVDVRKGKRGELERFLRDKANPMLAVGMSKVCEPWAPDMFYVIPTDGDGTPVPVRYGKQAALTELSIKGLSWCAVQLEDMPQLKMVETFAKPMMPYAGAVGLVGIMALQGMRLWNLRQQLVAQGLAVQAEQRRQQAASEAAPAGPHQGPPGTPAPESPNNTDTGARIPPMGRAPKSGPGFGGPVAMNDDEPESGDVLDETG